MADRKAGLGTHKETEIGEKYVLDKAVRPGKIETTGNVKKQKGMTDKEPENWERVDVNR